MTNPSEGTGAHPEFEDLLDGHPSPEHVGDSRHPDRESDEFRVQTEIHVLLRTMHAMDGARDRTALIMIAIRSARIQATRKVLRSDRYRTELRRRRVRGGFPRGHILRWTVAAVIVIGAMLGWMATGAERASIRADAGSVIADAPDGSPILARGRATVSVDARPGSVPWRMRTPHTAIEVVGTEFTLDVEPEATAIDVHHGRIILTPAPDMIASSLDLAGPVRAWVISRTALEHIADEVSANPGGDMPDRGSHREDLLPPVAPLAAGATHPLIATMPSDGAVLVISAGRPVLGQEPEFDIIAPDLVQVRKLPVPIVRVPIPGGDQIIEIRIRRLGKRSLIDWYDMSVIIDGAVSGRGLFASRGSGLQIVNRAGPPLRITSISLLDIAPP